MLSSVYPNSVFNSFVKVLEKLKYNFLTLFPDTEDTGQSVLLHLASVGQDEDSQSNTGHLSVVIRATVFNSQTPGTSWVG